MPGPGGVSLVYGVSPEFAMSRLDEAIHPELHVFVEDREAVILVREIIASANDGHEVLARLDIIPVGPANVVQIMGQLSHAGRLPYNALAVLDGDEDVSVGCLKLPGNLAPERVVFNQLKASTWPNLPARFGIGAGNLITYLEDAMLEPDHHRWLEMVGDRVLKSKTSVWETLTSEWVRSCLPPAERDSFVEAVKAKLP